MTFEEYTRAIEWPPTVDRGPRHGYRGLYPTGYSLQPCSPHPLFSERVRTKRRRQVIVASVFITGSADGLGRLAAQGLLT